MISASMRSGTVGTSTSQSCTAAFSSPSEKAWSRADSTTSNNSAMRASKCGINWRETMKRGRLGRGESGMVVDRARPRARVKGRPGGTEGTRVAEGKSVSVRVEHCGGRVINKKNQRHIKYD